VLRLPDFYFLGENPEFCDQKFDFVCSKIDWVKFFFSFLLKNAFTTNDERFLQTIVMQRSSGDR